MTICDFLLNVRETSKIFIFTVTEINPGVRRQVPSSHVRLLLKPRSHDASRLAASRIRRALTVRARGFLA
jgi:hypothetical protein